MAEAGAETTGVAEGLVACSEAEATGVAIEAAEGPAADGPAQAEATDVAEGAAGAAAGPASDGPAEADVAEGAAGAAAEAQESTRDLTYSLIFGLPVTSATS